MLTLSDSKTSTFHFAKPFRFIAKLWTARSIRRSHKSKETTSLISFYRQSAQEHNRWKKNTIGTIQQVWS